jgi:RND superfamily putative drug exporter
VIIARPGLILATSLLLLLPFAGYGFFRVETTDDLVSELSADRPSVQGTAMLRMHFAAGAGGPVNLVAYHPSADFRSRESGPNDDQLLIRDLTKYLASVEGVQRVRSWYTPFGEKRMSAAQQASQRSLAEDRYVSQAPEFEGRVMRMQLVLDRDPFSLESAQRLAHLRSRLDQLSGGEAPAHAATLELAGPPLDQAWRGAQFELAGTTATTTDLRTVTTADNRKIQILCTLAVWAVMLVLLRRPLICTYLIVSVLFTYFVSLGATQLVFQYAFGPEFIGLDWKVPLFLFVILVAVGADYNIYLVTRVFEEQQRLGLLEGLREAVARTGGIISSCGIIMVGSFLSMMSGTLHAILELGFALSLGILLDTFVVRPILVPAFLAFVYRWQLRRERAVAQRGIIRPVRPSPAPHHEPAAELVESI